MDISLFKTCGKNVKVAPDAYFEHPECVELGDEVVIMRGFHMLGAPKCCRFGNHVTFYPNCVVTGSPDRFLVDHHVTFLTGTHLSLGDAAGFVEIGHTTHFAPYCVLYGWGRKIVAACLELESRLVPGKEPQGARLEPSNAVWDFGSLGPELD